MTEIIDNRKKRIADLKTIIRKLHAGASPETVRHELKTIVKQCDAGEIAAMEHQLMEEEGIPVEQIMGMCDLHSEVVKEILTEREHGEIKSGHPVDIFRRENEALRQVISNVKECLNRLAKNPTTADYRQLREWFNQLMDVDKHYARKENLLFSVLERYGITGPSKVMWGVDDQIRDNLKVFGERITKDADNTPEEWQQIRDTIAKKALASMEMMFEKEENILLPMALESLTAVEWGEIWEQSPQFGWCIIEPDGEYAPPKSVKREISERARVELKIAGIALDEITEATDKRLAEKRKASETIENGLTATNRVVFPTGSLTFEQLKVIFEHLPVDLTFVDADDRVRFYSEGKSRIFARAQAVIGRKVQNCHPPASVNIVEKILDDFKSGRQDVADFWLNFKDRFVFVRYFALRNQKNDYVGCLEVTQDLTRERALEGERRILQYD